VFYDLLFNLGENIKKYQEDKVSTDFIFNAEEWIIPYIIHS